MKQKSNKIELLCLAGIMAAMYVGLDFLAVSISAPFGGNLKIEWTIINSLNKYIHD